MYQRSKKQARVRVHFTVDIKTREMAEKIAGASIAAGKRTTVCVVMGELLDDVRVLRTAKTHAERLAAAERLAGKPLTLPTVAT